MGQHEPRWRRSRSGAAPQCLCSWRGESLLPRSHPLDSGFLPASALLAFIRPPPGLAAALGATGRRRREVRPGGGEQRPFQSIGSNLDKGVERGRVVEHFGLAEPRVSTNVIRQVGSRQGRPLLDVSTPPGWDQSATTPASPFAPQDR